MTDRRVTYVLANNKARARSHVARRIVQVELATPTQMADDAQGGISLQPEKAEDSEGDTKR